MAASSNTTFQDSGDPTSAVSAIRAAMLCRLTRVLDRLQVTDSMADVTGGDDTLIDEALTNMADAVDAAFTEAVGKLVTNLLFDVRRLKAVYEESKKAAFIQSHTDELAVSLLYASRCPITLRPMKNPVVAMDGFIYERSALEMLVGTCDRTKSPVTNKEMIPTLISSAPVVKMLKDIKTLQQGLAEQAWMHEEAVKAIKLGLGKKTSMPPITLTDACGTVHVPNYGDTDNTSSL